jgi:carboxymethylenebutenolidase
MSIQRLLVIVVALGVCVVVLWWWRGGAVTVVDDRSNNAPAEMVSAVVPYVVRAEPVTYAPEATGYYAAPSEAGDYPGVVMIHENRGLRPEIKQAAEELAAEGYRVLAVDLFKGTVMETQEEARAYRERYNPGEGLVNLKAAVAYLRAAGAPTIASLGWCFGGAESLALATADESLDATVIYYGRLTDDRSLLSRVRAPVLGIFGDQDQVVSTTSVATFEATLRDLSVPVEIHMYEGVGHAFANPSNPNHAPTETADAWEKTLAFLEKNLK